MRYDLNQLSDPTRFQSLVNAILTARFGEDARLTPLRGPDGGADGETAPFHPYLEFDSTNTSATTTDPFLLPPRPGRYLFQAKYHRTGEERLSDLRARVVHEFRHELTTAVLNPPDRNDVNYFFLVTNLSSSKDAQRKVDDIRKELLRTRRNQLHADVWWAEMLTAWLDWSPTIWLSFPDIFPGGIIPRPLTIPGADTDESSRPFRLAVSTQYDRDRRIKFRQIELDQQLLDLFVDLDVQLRSDSDAIWSAKLSHDGQVPDEILSRHFPDSALTLLLHDHAAPRRILLEGGPGQGKSTVTQMAAQIYREKLLSEKPSVSRNPEWHELSRQRFPIRLELREFAAWLSEAKGSTLEEYIAHLTTEDSGGVSVTVGQLHTFLQNSPIILILDGLDEIGSDSLRNRVLDAARASIRRFEDGLNADLRVVLTSRPPALAGRRDSLDGFVRAILNPMDYHRVDDYLQRWLTVRVMDAEERDRISKSFAKCRQDQHVEVLARNPMQLSVLLQLIYLKADAFPDRRSELYRAYFQIVIDRDVEKSPELRPDRERLEGLHCFLGFYFHAAMEKGEAGRAAKRKEIVKLSSRWLEAEGRPKDLAERYFRLGEERFGLIVALSGEGEETTYGFEVQPIQEYFAALYISDHLPADWPHEIFQLLVHRSYWREVALFLAGLRRPSEKADLIARAKKADDDTNAPPQKNGRIIILQLLREGVLHQRPYVLAEAMRGIRDLLEVSTLRIQRNPDAIVDAACALAKQHPLDETRFWIGDLARRHADSNDEHALAVVHRLAARLLPPDEYKSVVVNYRGTSARSRALVHMTCPYEAIDVLSPLMENEDYWPDVEEVPVWAGHFWRAAAHHGVVVDSKYPEGLHAALVTEFAVAPGWGGRGERSILTVKAGSAAVWRLQQNLEVVRSLLTLRIEPSPSENSAGASLRSRESSAGWTSGQADYSLLPEDVASCLRDLVDTSDQLVSALLSDRGMTAVRSAANGHLAAIAAHLRDAGLAGWVACRCAAVLVELLATGRGRETVAASEQLDVVSESLRSFYGVRDNVAPVELLAHHARRNPPTAVRLARGQELIRMDRLIANVVLRRPDAVQGDEWSWVNHIPVMSGLLRPLARACRGDLRALLRFLGERPVIGLFRARPLLTADTRSVLEICQDTEDSDILGGVATVLTVANFLQGASPELVVKILAAAPNSQLLRVVLSPMGVNRRKVGKRTLKKERAVAVATARLVVEQADEYPFRIVNAAANFLADTDVVSGLPLIDERPNLADPRLVCVGSLLSHRVPNQSGLESLCLIE